MAPARKKEQIAPPADRRTAATPVDLTAHDAAGPDAVCGDEPLLGLVEALLVSADRPLSEGRLVELLGLPDRGGSVDAVREAIETLNAAYDADGRAMRAERLAGGWQILTRSKFGPLLGRLHADRQRSRLSPAAMETLAIVSYRQPIIRAEIEAIRGVACGEVLRGLLERRLVKIVGRAEELGRPMLYGTTKEFLKAFGLANLGDLPSVEGIGTEAMRKTPPETPAEENTDESGGA